MRLRSRPQLAFACVVLSGACASGSPRSEASAVLDQATLGGSAADIEAAIKHMEAFDSEARPRDEKIAVVYLALAHALYVRHVNADRGAVVQASSAIERAYALSAGDERQRGGLADAACDVVRSTTDEVAARKSLQVIEAEGEQCTLGALVNSAEAAPDSAAAVDEASESSSAFAQAAKRFAQVPTVTLEDAAQLKKGRPKDPTKACHSDPTLEMQMGYTGCEELIEANPQDVRALLRLANFYLGFVPPGWAPDRIRLKQAKKLIAQAERVELTGDAKRARDAEIKEVRAKIETTFGAGASK